jgi:UDP-glucuronate decarboxylase
MSINDGRVVSNFIVQALSNSDITIYGSGNQTRSFCYVDDLIDGILKLMDSDEDVVGPINLGNPIEYTMNELAQTAIKLTGSSSSLKRLELPIDDPKQRKPDISLAMELLGWEPKINLEEGMLATIDYFQKVLSTKI